MSCERENLARTRGPRPPGAGKARPGAAGPDGPRRRHGRADVLVYTLPTR